MANTILTHEIIAKQALATLYESLVVRPLVHTDLSSNFKGMAVGDTVNVRKPATFAAKDFEQSSGIEIQDITEGKVPVKLDKFKDVSFTVTSADLALSIEDFDEQFLTPAMQAIAAAVDTELLNLGKKVTQVVGDKTTPEYPWNKPESLLAAGAILGVNQVPQMGRNVVVGPYTQAAWLSSPLLKQVNHSGSTEGLRRASLGKDLFGFDAYMSPYVAQPKPKTSQQSGDQTTEAGLAFHQSAIAFASANLDLPPGAKGSIESFEGLSLRVVSDYDIKTKSTTVSVDMLFGVELLDPKRAVLIKGDDKD